MALTPEQLKYIEQNKAKREGIIPARTVSREDARRLLNLEKVQEEVEEKESTFFSRVGENLKQRGTQIKSTFGKAARGEINPVEAGFRAVGDVAGVVGDVAGAALEPEIKKLAETEWAKPAFEKLAQGMEVYEGWKKENPSNERIGKMIESVSNIADVFGVLAAGKATAKTVAKTASNIGAKAAETTAKILPKITETTELGTKVAKDIIPTRGDVISGQITKALDLTQGDISNIKLSSGNEVGEWIANKNIIGGNKKETLDNIKKVVDTQYKTVRDEIGKVPTIYTPETTPRIKDALTELKQSTEGVLGLEKVNSEIATLAKKTDYTLNDVQRVKELVDDQFDLYKATGDVKAGQAKAGLANVRKELKTFIEKEVKDTTGADIGSMNNDVSTGKSILNLASKRSTRGFTRANVSLSDLGFFGAGSIAGTPLVGAAALLGKRIVETPAFRLKFAKFLKALPKKEADVVKSKLLKGEVPNNLPEELKLLSESQEGAGKLSSKDGNESLFAGVGGVETYEDENGDIKTRFSPFKAALGIGLMSGANKIKPETLVKVSRNLVKEDKKIMMDFLDAKYLNKNISPDLETQARYFLEGAGIKPDISNTKIANIFNEILAREHQFNKDVKMGKIGWKASKK